MENELQTDKKSIFLIATTILALPFSWVVLPVGGSVYRLLIIVLFALFIILKSGRISFSKDDTFFMWFALYCFLSVVSILWSRNTEDAKNVAFGYILLLMVAAIYLTNAKKIPIKTYEVLWIITGIIWIALFFMGEKRIFSFSSRVSISLLGNDTDPNEYAGALVVPACVIANRLFNKTKLVHRILYIGLLLIVTYIVFFTGSRGGLLALMIGVLTTVVVKKGGSLKGTIRFIIFSIVFIVIVFYIIIPALPQDITMRFTFVSLQESGGSNRELIWQQAFEQVRNDNVFYLLFGHGGFGGTSTRGTMHNQLIQTFTDFGIVGIVGYIGLTIAIFKRFIKYNKPFLGALVGMQVLSMTLTLYPSYKPLWIFLFMGFANTGVVSERKEFK